jgi:hypothetical protein
MSTVRFANVVKKSGKPEPYTLWTDPKKDAEFQRALKAQRVMTVHQENVGAKSDYGSVGFTGDKSASLLLFPKSLASFEGKHVVGIKYDLLESPEPGARAKPKPSRQPAKAPKPKRTSKHPANNVISFAKEAKEEAPKEERTPAPKQRPPNRLQREIRKVMKTLKAGKAVAAYEMLERLEGRLSDAG